MKPATPRKVGLRAIRRQVVRETRPRLRCEREPLIIRWIGAAGRRRRRKHADRDADLAPASSNIVRLTWADTFGRPPHVTAIDRDDARTVLSMLKKPRCRAADIRTRDGIARAI